MVAARPMSLNPYVGATDPAVRDVGHLLYRSLLRLDQDAFPRPDLASSYTVSPDGLTYHVVLGVAHRWSDGQEITVNDVLATVDFAQSPATGDQAMSAQLQGVKVTPSAGAIAFTLPAPRASFAATLSQLPILPLGSLSAARSAALVTRPSAAMATSGAYEVQSADGNNVVLARNPYASQRAAMGSVQLRLFSAFADAAAAFSAGQVDGVLAITPAQRAQLLSVKGSVAHDIATFRFVDLLFNQRTPGLDDQLVRHALGAAVSRTGIVSGALQGAGGLVQVSPISDGLRWAAPASNLELAEPTVSAQALEGDGWTIGPAGVRERRGVVLAYTLSVPDADPLPTVAHELAQQLAAVGVTIDVNVVPAMDFVVKTLVPHAFQMALADWDSGPDPDISAFWRSNAKPPKGFNVSGGKTDPFLDQSLDSLATLSDPAARLAAAQSVIQHLAEDAPAIFLYTPEVSYVVRGGMKHMPIPMLGGSAARFDSVAQWQRS